MSFFKVITYYTASCCKTLCNLLTWIPRAHISCVFIELVAAGLWSRGWAVIYEPSSCCGLITSKSPEEVTRGHNPGLF